MSAILALEGVTRSFGKVNALDDVSLEVGKGEIAGVLGPSGAGKSTLLRLAGLLDNPTRGRVLFEGRELSPEGDGDLLQRRKMAMILQKPVVFRGSVMHNATFGLGVRGYPEAQSRELAAPVLKGLGLLELADRPASTLSGGEVQRLAFARATVLRPEILLLDEFTANLDPANVVVLENGVRRFRERGGTVVMVTHNLAQGKRLADRIFLLLGGRLVETAPSASFFDSPGTKQAREFLNGTMVW